MKFKDILVGVRIFVIAILAFVLLRMVACLVPSDIVRNHIKEGVAYYEETGDFGELRDGQTYWNTIDYSTDYYYLATCYVMDRSALLSGTLQNVVVQKTVDDIIRGSDILKASILMDFDSITNFNVYWFGQVGVLRILLAFFNYREIQILTVIFMLLLFGITAIVLMRKLGPVEAVAFLVSLFMVRISKYIMAYSTTPPFLVACIAGLLILLLAKSKKDTYRILLLSGMLIAYLDWFSSPILTYCIPVMFALLSLYRRGELTSIKDDLCYLIHTAIDWVIGYVGTLFARWAILSVYTHENMFLTGLGHAQGDFTKGDVTRSALQIFCAAVKNNFGFIEGAHQMNNWWLIPLIILLALSILFALNIRNGNKNLHIYLACFLCSLGPLAWMFVFRGHNEIHLILTYRQLAAFIFCNLCVIYYLTRDLIKTVEGKGIQ